MMTRDVVRAAVNLPNFDPTEAARTIFPDVTPEQRTPPPGMTPRIAAVLVLIYPVDGVLHVLLTRRTEQLRGHSGQISFPGGRRDPGDESFTHTALRETCEELGICEADLDILGQMTTIYIPPSNFQVTPTVAYIPALPSLKPSPDEVAEVFGFALPDLLNPAFKREEIWTLNGVRRPVRFYQVGEHKVWGATAIMLAELEYRLRAVLSG